MKMISLRPAVPNTQATRAEHLGGPEEVIHTSTDLYVLISTTLEFF